MIVPVLATVALGAMLIQNQLASGLIEEVTIATLAGSIGRIMAGIICKSTCDTRIRERHDF